MGPTNVALVSYFKADQELRAAQARLDAASKDVRVQDRRVTDLAEKHKLAHQLLRESQSKTGAFELDLKTRDVHIEKLRTQQQNARNNKEYQTFLIEINTAKADRNKVEDDTMKLLEQVERGNKQLAEIARQLEDERGKLTALREQVGGKLQAIEAEIDAIKPKVEAAGTAVPGKAREVYDRLADRFEGEGMSALSKPDRRREEYVCSACNMELVVDIYNKLHSRDELVFCPSCRRILYIPEDLPPEVAIKGKSASAKKSVGEESDAPAKPRRTSKRVPSAGRSELADPVQRVLLKAAGESAQNSIAGGSAPAEFEILIDGQSMGFFKGQSAENLQRTARFCLNEAGISGELTVGEKREQSAAQSAGESAGEPADELPNNSDSPPSDLSQSVS